MSGAVRLWLSLKLAWDEIETVRQAVALCVDAAYGSVSLRDSLSMVSSELLENAVKYGTSGAAVQLVLEDLADGVRVAVTNAVDDVSPHSHTLQDRVAWLGKFEDPRRAYVAALERAFRDAGDGGLGLARIAHEGGCKVRCDASLPGEVTVSAYYRRPAAKPRPAEGARAP